MSKKKISIIVPVYNMEKYLARCVDSILAQTYTNIEVILVDDGSSDLSPEICDQYAMVDNRVKVIHKLNGGLSSARNAGLDVATGDYIGFVDSDDYISIDMYSVLAYQLDNYACDISCIGYVRVTNSNECYTSVLDNDCENICQEQYIQRILLNKADVSVCTKLFKKFLFEKVRFCDGKLNEDELFLIEALSLSSRISISRKIGYFYYYRPDSISSSFGKSVIDMVENSKWIRSFVVEKFPHLHGEAMRFELYKHMNFLLLIPKNYAIRDNDVYIKTLKFLKKNIFVAFGNKFLTLKNKLTMLGLTLIPITLAKIYQKKHHLTV